MINILTELKEMIKMQGGDPSQVKDIGIAVMELKKLMTKRSHNRDANATPSFKYESRKERRTEEA